MIYRKMLIEDYEKVYALWTICDGIGLNNLDDSKEGIDKFLKRNPDTCFVAEDGGIIVGAIMVGNDGRRAYIYHTAVHPSKRKLKIAGKLVACAVEELALLGINKAALVVFDTNEVGNAFWESQGFSVRSDLVYRNKLVSKKEM